MADLRDEIYYSYEDNYGFVETNPLIYAMSKFTDIFPENRMQRYIVKGSQPSTLMAISYTLYNTKDYWWLLGMLNGTNNFITPLPKNFIVYYPPVDLINTYKSELAEWMSATSGNNNKTYVGGNVQLF